MPDLIPYLAFDGNCAEAMRFYERALEGKLELVMSCADSPYPASSFFGWIQSTGQASTQAESLVPIHGSAITYAIGTISSKKTLNNGWFGSPNYAA